MISSISHQSKSLYLLNSNAVMFQNLHNVDDVCNFQIGFAFTYFVVDRFLISCIARLMIDLFSKK